VTPPDFFLRFECEFSGNVTLMLKKHAVKKGRYTEEQIAYALKQAQGVLSGFVFCLVATNRPTD
jgi:hypothetical protein